MPLSAGVTAPAFRLPSSDGVARGLADVADGTAAVLAFFKMSCGTCQTTFGVFGELERRFRSAAPVVAVAQDAMAPAKGWLAERGFDGLVLNDSYDGYAVSRAFDIQAVPTLVLIDASGAVDRVAEGWSRDDVNALAVRLAELTGRPEAVDPPVSTPDDGLPPHKPG